MSVREKRLQNDFQNLSKLVDNSGETLAIISTSGNPPYEYVIEYGADNHDGWAWYKNNRHHFPVGIQTFKAAQAPPGMVWNELTEANSTQANIMFLDL